MSEASALLSEQLSLVGIPHDLEVMFAKPRRWRFDVEFPVQYIDHWWGHIHLAVEVDGGGWIGGRHSRGGGIENDCEKLSTAVSMGYTVMRVTPKQVKDGRALEWIRRALGETDIQVDPRPLSLLQ